MKHLFYAAILLASVSCRSDEFVEVRYLGYIFKVPEGPSIVATTGDENNTLIFKYGEAQGTESILFSSNENDPLFDSFQKSEGCDYPAFLDELFTQQENTVCDPQQLEAFSKVLLQGTEHGVWQGADMRIYFALGDDRSFLIFGGDDTRNVKIESGFLTEQQLRALVSNYL